MCKRLNDEELQLYRCGKYRDVEALLKHVDALTEELERTHALLDAAMCRLVSLMNKWGFPAWFEKMQEEWKSL